MVEREDPCILVDAADLDPTGEDVLAVPVALAHSSPHGPGPPRFPTCGPKLRMRLRGEPARWYDSARRFASSDGTPCSRSVRWNARTPLFRWRCIRRKPTPSRRRKPGTRAAIAIGRADSGILLRIPLPLVPSTPR